MRRHHPHISPAAADAVQPMAIDWQAPSRQELERIALLTEVAQQARCLADETEKLARTAAEELKRVLELMK